MTFIGIITEQKKENYIKQVLVRYLDGKKPVIFIDEKNIDNIKNVKFETILILEHNDKLFQKEDILKQILENTNYLIINSDMKTNLEMLDNLNVNVITYGFNSKATITASSVTEENILLCVQRNIQTVKGETMESQEIKIGLDKPDVMDTPNNIMGIATLLLIYGKKEVKI